MMFEKKRFMALFLSFVLLFSLCPVSVFAQEGEELMEGEGVPEPTSVSAEIEAAAEEAEEVVPPSEEPSFEAPAEVEAEEPLSAITLTSLYIAAKPEVGLDGEVTVSLSSSGSYSSKTYKGTAYLPGSADLSALYLSWADTSMSVKVNNVSYQSGAAPLPAANGSLSYTFVKGSSTQSCTLTLYKGSAGVSGMFITIDETLGTISAMHASSNHSVSCFGSLTMDGSTNYVEMKGRGNSTWTYGKSKRPYNITFYKAADYADKKNVEMISGIKTKKWSLLANYADGSLLRNKVGYDLACGLGIGLESRFVDIWVNGSYYGNYLMTPKSDYQAPKGGYFVELDNKVESEDPQFALTGLKTTTSAFQNKITVKDIGSKAEEAGITATEIQSWMQTMLNAVLDTKSENYLNYIDLDSFAKLYILQEFYKSYDILSGSMFMYRNGLTDADKLFAGPVWDCDNAMGRSQTCSSSDCGLDTTIQRSADGWVIDSVSSSFTCFMQFLGKHESFMKRVYEIYNQYAGCFDYVATDLEVQAALIADSAAMNFKKYSPTQSEYNVTKYDSAQTIGSGTYGCSYIKTTTWENFVTNLNTYVTKRAAFFKSKLAVSVPGGSISGNTNVNLNTGFTLTATPATADSSLRYQWQSSSDGTEWADIAGAASAAYSATALGSMNNQQLRCVFSKSGSTVSTSNVAKVAPSASVNLAPVTLTVNISWGSTGYQWADDGSSCTAKRVCTTDSTLMETAEASVTHTTTTPASCTQKGETTHSAVFEASWAETQTKKTPIEMLPHSPETVKGKAATCTESGLTDGSRCSVCKKTLTEQQVIEPLNHSWGEASFVWSADYSSCTASSVCANNSSHSDSETVSTTAVTTGKCEQTGSTAYTAVFTKDWVSKKTQVKNVSIPSISHSWGQVEYVWNKDHSQCTATQKCSNDPDGEHTRTETVNSSCVTVEPKCEQSGLRTYTAVFTGAWATQQTYAEVLEAIGHSWNSVEYRWSADKSQCTASRSCKRDASHIQSETVNASSAVTTSAGCEQPGVRTYTATFSGDWVTEKTQSTTSELSVLGHDWNSVEYIWNEDHSQCTATRTCRRDASHTESETVSSSCVTVTPKCEQAGSHTYTAVFTGAWATQQTYTVVLDALGHDWNSVEYRWSADKAQCTASRSCKRNPSHIQSETVNAGSAVTTSAGCEQPGVRSYTAIFSGDWVSQKAQITTEALSALGHDWNTAEYVWNEDHSQCTATRTCRRNASHTEKETVDANCIITDPGCEQTGLRTYTAVFNGAWATRQTYSEVLEAIGHSWNSVEYRWSADNSQCTASRSCKRDASHIQSETVNAASSVTLAPKCESNGIRRYTAVFKSSWVTQKTQTTEVELAALDHLWSETSYNWSSNHLSCTATRSCARDTRHIETAEGFISSAVTVAPKCEQAGVRSYTAVFEQSWAKEQLSTVEVAATGHDWAPASYSWNDSLSACTATRACFHDGSHIQTSEAEVHEQLLLAPLCEAEGSKLVTASFQDFWAYSQEKTAVVPALEHDWSEVEYIWSRSYNSCTARRTCKHDSSHISTAEGEINTITAEAKCGIEGSVSYSAVFTADWADSQLVSGHIIPALEHRWVFEETDTSRIPYENCFRCELCQGEKRETVPTPLASSMKLNCEDTLAVSVTDEEPLVLTASLLPDNADQTVSWSGMDDSFAEFVQEGNSLTLKNFTGKTGSLALTVTAEDGSKVKSRIELNFDVCPESLSILNSKNEAPASPVISGKSSASFKTSIDSDKTITNKNVIWELSNDEYATVDQRGNVSVRPFAGTEHNVVLTATSAAKKSVLDSITLTLTPNLTENVEIRADGKLVNDSTLTADVMGASPLLSATAVGVSGELSWKSSAVNVAAVDALTGELKLLAPGKATITASCGRVKSSFKLEVIRKVDSIELSGPDTVYSGKSASFKATLSPAKPSDKTILWSLAAGDESYATIRNGKLSVNKTLHQPVTVTLIAESRDGNARSERQIQLVPIATAVTISGAPATSLDLSEELKLSASVSPLTANQTVKWTSSNARSFSIDENGCVTVNPGAKAGNVTFTATATDGSGKKAKVKVRFVQLMTLDDLSIQTEYDTVPGKSVQFKAKVNSAVTNKKLVYTMEDSPYATLSGSRLNITKGLVLSEAVTLTVLVSAADGSGISRELHVTIRPLTTSVELRESGTGRILNDETLNELPRYILVRSYPETAAQSWVVRCNNSAMVCAVEGNMLVYSLKEGRTLRDGTILTFTVTASDGSAQSARFNVVYYSSELIQ